MNAVSFAPAVGAVVRFGNPPAASHCTERSVKTYNRSGLPDVKDY